MTDRLYYNDPYLQAFDALVLRLADRGGRSAVTLDRTAFYPTSGGQPFDTGTLGPFRVVDVVDEDDGGRAAGSLTGSSKKKVAPPHSFPRWPIAPPYDSMMP